MKHCSSARARRGRIRLRPLDMKRYGEELALLIEIFNDAWSENWEFMPFTQAEAAHSPRACGR